MGGLGRRGCLAQVSTSPFLYGVTSTMKHITIRYTGEKSAVPSYESEGASGGDLKAFIDKDVIIEPGKRALIPTGLFIEVPEGYEAQVRPRSGLAVRNGIVVLNTPGTVDADYRGEIKVILCNLGEDPFVVKNGDRIAQMVICPVFQAEYEWAEVLNESKRGSGGFGSTGS